MCLLSVEGRCTYVCIYQLADIWSCCSALGSDFVVFVVVKIRNTVQRKKYSVKQDGDVSTEYESRGLH